MPDGPKAVQIILKASISPVSTAIKVDGQGGGARIQLDIPESEMLQVVQLAAMREMALRVTIEATNDEGYPRSAG